MQVGVGQPPGVIVVAHEPLNTEGVALGVHGGGRAAQTRRAQRAHAPDAALEVDRVRDPVLGRVQRELGAVTSLVAVEVRLVARRVAADAAHVVLLPAVHRDVALEQRLPTEVAAADATVVAVPMATQHVVAQRRLQVLPWNFEFQDNCYI